MKPDPFYDHDLEMLDKLAIGANRMTAEEKAGMLEVRARERARDLPAADRVPTRRDRRRFEAIARRLGR